ncbi:MAG: 3-deoxy-8-phosphooctulonate synthase [Sulfurovum sp.]|nr:3-deoxy-8-phosphooctulonate synthase [Sulfurovum sp.]MCB4746460.1 3-deoxy-8-phosphooctulonate synthase [Sulfurovum sp.]MCB4749449.1 3-deoxy-8-phosphooctulonate synthase [Sulfurovum sp.]MCB4763790.1 3-deoxy-8-phosphooctulonate synthase [Sulfurovum sp.]MCB4774070.1 3-deoxy-8-phosphooctulonate synthase [Sulfurovum sp.]
MILIAGPCVLESRDNVMRIAESLNKYHEDCTKNFYFKASFDKANRTSLDSFRGPGLEEGLKMLAEIKEQFGYKILTDVHDYTQPQAVAEVADVLQIPAFLCRQTDLLIAVAKTDAVVNIKKGQFLAPAAMEHSVKKILKTRGFEGKVSYKNAQKYKVWLTERGTTFGYGNLIVDMRGLVTMREFAPVIFDATHSVQMPASGGTSSGGDSLFVPYLSRAAASIGVDGFFFETHFDPSIALSDGPNMIQLQKLDTLIEQIDTIRLIVE